MKKYLNIALAYALAAMAGGVFFREFTKLCGFEGVTALGRVHVHLFVLGMLVFLLVALFAGRMELQGSRLFRVFMPVYNAGVVLTAMMMLVRGVMQVKAVELTRGMSAAISGVAGIGHILTGVGIVLLLLALRGAARD